MSVISLEVVTLATAAQQRVTRAADRGYVGAGSIVLLSGTALFGSTFARISIVDRSGPSILYVATLAAGYIYNASAVSWNGFFTLQSNNELALDVWSTTAGNVVRANFLLGRMEGD